jgi:hypothetical protein
VTATTLRCEAVDDEVTVLVYKDWSVKCTGYGKYGSSHQTKKGKAVRCSGPECLAAIGYRQKLQAQEAEANHNE